MPHRNGQNLSSQQGMNTTASKSWQMCRPRTLPDLVSYGSLISATMPDDQPRVPPKLLLKVTVQGNLGPVQVVMTAKSSVKDLVEATVQRYVKEGRRPVVPSTDPSDFDLHYSQFSLESLRREEKLIELGSRNFFLCPRKCHGMSKENAGGATTSFVPCSREVDRVTKTGLLRPTSNWFAAQICLHDILRKWEIVCHNATYRVAPYCLRFLRVNNFPLDNDIN